MIDATVIDEISGDARARSNVIRLAAAQALTGANSAVIFATGSIVGATLAPNVAFAPDGKTLVLAAGGLREKVKGIGAISTMSTEARSGLGSVSAHASTPSFW